MDYQVTEKTIPAATVYYSEATLEKYSDAMQWIPAQGAEVRALNPDLKCVEPSAEEIQKLVCLAREAVRASSFSCGSSRS